MMCSTRIAHTLFTIFCRKIEFLQEKLNSPTQDPRMIDFFLTITAWTVTVKKQVSRDQNY